jgi:cobalamin biosynthetic protein CobC
VTETPLDAALNDFSYHGGNLGAARLLFPGAPTPWIDLSTGINPCPYPLPALAGELWSRLPEPAQVAALEAEAARRYGAEAGATIAAAGTQAIIQTLPWLRPASRVGVLGLSYSGHEHAWRAAHAAVSAVEDIADLAAFDAAVIVNPNNPDGRLVELSSLLALHEKLAARGGILIVDEAFMDIDDRGQSLIPSLPASRAIVLRSFGKIYGLAGVRLGFAVASAELVAPLRAALGPWPVSGPAIAIGRAALADDRWLEETKRRLARDAAWLDLLLAGRAFEALGGTHLFRLVRHPQAPQIFIALMREGILVRPFAAFPDRLRFGLPDGAQAWSRLEAALESQR